MLFSVLIKKQLFMLKDLRRGGGIKIKKEEI
jgi:hypothetical protein